METWMPLLGEARCDVAHTGLPDIACQLPTGHGNRHWHLRGADVFAWVPSKLELRVW